VSSPFLRALGYTTGAAAGMLVAAIAAMNRF
jgi:hypothetical protein